MSNSRNEFSTELQMTLWPLFIGLLIIVFWVALVLSWPSTPKEEALRKIERIRDEFNLEMDRQQLEAARRNAYETLGEFHYDRQLYRYKLWKITCHTNEELDLIIRELKMKD